ncbi:hypothetical protein FRACA_1680008 [Frankia canadensis]|uniref:Uncharacterized protein n=1 Tax=Frankia canadensis TaxID=1836972 RepID=A0A2I2KMY3_9ACTN|nr:hypothetical protein FRACA_1680008 [Frankia canadensis]SOU54310.1 hypothetical protein FRACA_1680008 [Frankia canadensis]
MRRRRGCKVDFASTLKIASFRP